MTDLVQGLKDATKSGRDRNKYTLADVRACILTSLRGYSIRSYYTLLRHCSAFALCFHV